MKIILKISGEALKGNQKLVQEDKLEIILKLIRNLRKDNHQIGIVIGGGNFFRGRENPHMDKVTGDTIGMLSSVMNALYLKDYLNKNNIIASVSTPFDFPNLLANYSKEELQKKSLNNEVIIFGGGVGLSGYSTDSGTILARDTLEAELIIKLTNVDGVYSEDPKNNPQAQKFTKLSYHDVIENNYQVMDLYAVKHCEEKKTKILVMNFLDYDKINYYFEKREIGTIIGD